MGRVARIRIGISGWNYAGWRGDFYPKGLVQRRELAYAAERLGSIEINGSFYSLQKPDYYARWRDELTTVEELGTVLAPVATPIAIAAEGPVAVKAAKDVEGVRSGHDDLLE